MPDEPTKLSRSSPGAYVTSIDALGGAIVGVATAVPAFIGYTEYAGDPTNGEPLYMKPVAISSLAEFTASFGGPAPPHYEVAPVAPPATPDFTACSTSAAPDCDVALTGFSLARVTSGSEPARFNLYWQMRLFFANGGGPCVIVSVGSYWDGRFPVEAPDPVPPGWAPGAIRAGTAQPPADLLGGLAVAGEAVEPTMIVIPEACQLGADDYAEVAVAMVGQAASLQDRVAILDLPGCLDAGTIDLLQAAQRNLWTAIGAALADPSYGVAYGPALQADIVTAQDLLYTVLAAGAGGDNVVINDILTTQAFQLYERSPDRLSATRAAIAAALPLDASFGTDNNRRYSLNAAGYPPFDPAKTTRDDWQRTLTQALAAALPVFGTIMGLVATAMNVSPPSGALAGIWAANDAQNGVWSAPANIAVTPILAPLYAMNDVQQAAFNQPANGMAINVLRLLSNRGTIVWGARTLDGNSQDYRYVPVRRTVNYIQQSIATALRSYAPAANDATTWAAVSASISAFLTALWQQGGLIGDKANDAFTVSCGVGSTMVIQDVLDGRIRVAVTVALTRPAEYLELTIDQAMSG